MDHLLKVLEAASGAWRPLIIPSACEGEPTVVTRLASRYLESLRQREEYAGALPQLLLRLLQGDGDGDGWFKVRFCCKLIRLGRESCLPTSALTKGYEVALSYLENCFKAAGDCSTSILHNLSWGRDSAKLLAMVRSILVKHTSMAARPAELQHLASLVLESFISITLDQQEDDNAEEHGSEAKMETPRGASQLISYRHDRGLPLLRTHLLLHSLLLDLAPGALLAPGLQDPVWDSSAIPREPDNRGLVVAVFEASLELQGSHTSLSDSRLTAVVTSLDPLDASARVAERLALTHLANMLLRSGVSAVVCQRRVHPFLTQLLAAGGVTVLSRVSAVHIGEIVRLSGARQLGALSPSQATQPFSQVDPAHLGFLSSLYSIPSLTGAGSNCTVVCTAAGGPSAVRARALDMSDNWSHEARERYVSGVLSRRRPRHFLTICAPSSQLCLETEAAMRAALWALDGLLRCPVLLSRDWHTRLGSELSSLNSHELEAASVLFDLPANRDEDKYPFPLSPAQRGLGDADGGIKGNRFGLGDVGRASQLLGRALAQSAAGCSQLVAEAGADADAGCEPLLPARVALRSAVEAASCLLGVDGAL